VTKMFSEASIHTNWVTVKGLQHSTSNMLIQMLEPTFFPKLQV